MLTEKPLRQEQDVTDFGRMSSWFLNYLVIEMILRSSQNKSQVQWFLGGTCLTLRMCVLYLEANITEEDVVGF